MLYAFIFHRIFTNFSGNLTSTNVFPKQKSKNIRGVQSSEKARTYEESESEHEDVLVDRHFSVALSSNSSTNDKPPNLCSPPSDIAYHENLWIQMEISHRAQRKFSANIVNGYAVGGRRARLKLFQSCCLTLISQNFCLQQLICRGYICFPNILEACSLRLKILHIWVEIVSKIVWMRLLGK